MSDPASLLPPNATPQERALDLAPAAHLGAIPRPISRLWNPQTCPAALLPWLAWALSVDDWDADWPEQIRRDVIADSIGLHRVKGTLASVRRALAAAGYGAAEVVERYGWDFYDGTARHDGAITYVAPDHWAEYRIRLTRPITLEQAAQVRRILATVAPARCRLKALDYTRALNLYNARIRHDGRYSHGVA